MKRELQVDDKRDDVRAMIAVILVQQGDLSAALPWARDAAERAPSLALAQYIHGRILAETGSLDAGIERLQKSLLLDPDNIDCHIALAAALSRKGLAAEALRERLRTIEMARARATPAE
jgi:tetratricopeptide (TPR) repeat protein